MFCSNCGKEIQDTAKFCNGCGNAVSGGKAQPSASSSSPIEKLSKLSPSKKKAIAIISGVAVVAIVLIVVFINSMSLENRLTANTWYEVPDYDYHAFGHVVKFYDNGDGEMNIYYARKSPSNKKFEWKLTDDNELYFRGEYYSYGDGEDEWCFDGGDLIIGGSRFHSEDTWGCYFED
ncbi:MAG: zinc-ribbon domain-containing protein [Oscillospiraceae bacterium]|nr:zinc-ribbon domain-containing protein [Oscillospiraceae bacterium]